MSEFRSHFALKRRRSRRGKLRLVLSQLSPWCLAGLALVTFTAAAGENTRFDDPGFRRSVFVEHYRLTLMPPRISTLDIIRPKPFEQQDQTRLESWASLLPHIRKVDLSRPDIRGLKPGADLVFSQDRTVLPAMALDPALTLERAGRVLMAVLNRFDGRTQTPGAPLASGQTPMRAGQAQNLTLSRPDGSTPAVSSATRLASVTPAPVEPEIIAANSTRIPSIARLQLAPAPKPQRPGEPVVAQGYLGILDPESLKKEQKCLAEAIYFESRSEPEQGQAAVAQVVLNRVKSGLYPTSVCGVVYQNRHRYKACQFTFACEGKSLAITEPGPWATAQRIAKAVTEGTTYLPDVGTSTHYHATYVAPYWSRRLKKMDKIGSHIFYKLRPGQT